MSTSITRRTAEVPVFQGDDVAVIEEAEAAYNRAESLRRLAEVRTPSGRLDGGGEDTLSESTTAAIEAARAYDAAVEDALPRAVTVKVQALGRKTYRGLLAAHPPRNDNDGDAQVGFNRDDFFDALLEHFDGETGERTILAPDFKSKNELTAWLDELSDGVYTELGVTAVRLNQGGSPDPKASLTSQAEQMYGATSK